MSRKHNCPYLIDSSCCFQNFAIAPVVYVGLNEDPLAADKPGALDLCDQGDGPRGTAQTAHCLVVGQAERKLQPEKTSRAHTHNVLFLPTIKLRVSRAVMTRLDSDSSRIFVISTV